MFLYDHHDISWRKHLDYHFVLIDDQEKFNRCDVSPNGKLVVSLSHERLARIWDKTNEPLVLQEWSICIY